MEELELMLLKRAKKDGVLNRYGNVYKVYYKYRFGSEDFSPPPTLASFTDETTFPCLMRLVDKGYLKRDGNEAFIYNYS